MHRLVAVLLAAVSLCCLPLRPLWVDEIFQLEGTWQQTYPQMVHDAMTAPGGMPLAYAAQKAWLDVAGFSTAKARVPAYVFGVGTVLLLLALARELGLSRLATMVGAFLMPLLFRYTTEARPYSQGLFFSVLCTVLLVRWLREPRAVWLMAYGASCIAGVYSQPFALFVSCAHAAYLFFHERRRFVPIAATVLLTGLLYFPWVWLSQRALRGESWPHEMFFSFRQVSPLLVIREISGGGYLCSLPLLLLAVWGWRNQPGRLGILAYCVVIPAILGVAADAAGNYFFAIRQLIFIVPPLLLLAIAGLIQTGIASRRWAAGAAGVFLLGSVIKDIRWQADHKEDWAGAARRIASLSQDRRGCIDFEPAGDAKHYYFFVQDLKGRGCSGLGAEPVAWRVVSPYAKSQMRASALAASAQNVGNSLIEAAK